MTMNSANPMRLKGKKAVVIGAGSVGDTDGNGSATATKFAQEGAAVICADIHFASAKKVSDAITRQHGVAYPFEVDIASKTGIEELMKFSIEKLGQVDILHNNVGISIRGDLLDITEEAWDKVLNTNLKGAMLSNQAALRHMIERGIPGSITNVSSTASKRWTPMQFLSYSTSKAALNQMTKINARQFAKHQVRFNLILPGLIDTPHSDALYSSPEEAKIYKQIRSERCPMGRQGSVWEVAEAAVFINSDDAAYITGLELVVDGGITL